MLRRNSLTGMALLVLALGLFSSSAWAQGLGGPPAGLTNPLSGTITGTYTLGGTPTISFANAACDGTTDNSTALQAALNATGGYVRLPEGKVCAFGTTLTLPSDSVIQIPSGTTLKWLGTGGTMFKTSTTVATNRTGVVGMGAASKIDANNQAAIIFDIHSGWDDKFSDFDIIGGTATSTAFKLRADVTPASAATNLAFGIFSHINVTGPIGTCMSMSGLATGPQVVTLNTIVGLTCDDTRVIGADFQNWTDNNNFFSTYMSLTAANATGVIYNSATPASNVGVYNNHFYSIAIDCFAALGGRTGVQLNFTKQNSILDFTQFPTCELGSFVDSGASISHMIRFQADPAGVMIEYSKNKTNSGAATFTGGVQTFSVADGAQAILAAGATKGVRIIPNSAGTAIEGVDNTGSASYQPLILGGSYVAMQVSGANKFDCNLATASVCTFTGYPLNAAAGIQNNGKLLVSPTAPTISSGFGTSPSIVASNGSAAFEVNVGTGGTASSGVIGLPTATTGWNCQVTDITTASSTVFLTKQTASATNSCTVGNFNTAGAAAAWVASDKLRVTAFAY